MVNSSVEHVISPLSSNFAHYPADVWDSHPNTTGHQKATSEFVPLINVSYNSWKGEFPSVSKPAVTTGEPSFISFSAATLNGSVNANGAATTYHFEYGLTTGYGTNTPAMNAGSATKSIKVNATLSGLYPDTSYHYRLVATNSEGTSVGGDLPFATTPYTKVFGNIDGSLDGKVNLADAVAVLKVCADLSPSDVFPAAEIDGDQ